MLPSTFNMSVMAGAVDGSLLTDVTVESQVDAAGRTLDKHINYDSCFPALSDKLQIQMKGLYLNVPSISTCFFCVLL